MEISEKKIERNFKMGNIRILRLLIIAIAYKETNFNNLISQYIVGSIR